MLSVLVNTWFFATELMSESSVSSLLFFGCNSDPQGRHALPVFLSEQEHHRVPVPCSTSPRLESGSQLCSQSAPTPYLTLAKSLQPQV